MNELIIGITNERRAEPTGVEMKYIPDVLIDPFFENEGVDIEATLEQIFDVHTSVCHQGSTLPDVVAKLDFIFMEATCLAREKSEEPFMWRSYDIIGDHAIIGWIFAKNLEEIESRLAALEIHSS